MLPVPRKGSLPQLVAGGCAVPPCLAAGRDGEAQEQSHGSQGHQSWEYREFSISGVSLVWKEARPTPKSGREGIIESAWLGRTFKSIKSNRSPALRPH